MQRQITDFANILVCLKKCRYGNVFYKVGWDVTWMSRVYIINEDNGRKCFKLQKGARQSDPVSAYLLILCPEIVSILMKAN